ncbi:MAG TPA: hypothetical protein VF785_23250 [Gemmatimonadaceae bacterium]
MRFQVSAPLIVLAAMTSLACTTSRTTPPGSAPDPSRNPVSGKVPGQRTTASSQPNASRKRVDAKEEPATLVAFDRTRCVVTDQRFRDTKVGDTVTCDWRTGDRAP